MCFLIRLLMFTAPALALITPLPTTNKSTPLEDCGNHMCNSSISQTYNHYRQQGCFCDTLCQYYNDCCRDYNTSTHPRIDYPTTECRSPAQSNNPVMMIVSCSPNFKGSQYIIDRCNNNTLSELDTTIPVSGRNKQLVYRNRYCAQCNMETNYTFWNQKLNCPKIKTSENLTIDKVNFTECSHSFQDPYPNTSHLCVESLVKSCNNSLENECGREKNGIVFSNFGFFYKNRHCFQCNKRPEEELSCGYLRDEKILTTPYYISSSSYFILINFNRRDARLNDNKPLVTCPNGQWFNYLKGKCHHALDSRTSHNDTKVLNCLLEMLQKNEYILLPNKTMYRNSTKTFYDTDSYMIKNNSDVFICQLDAESSKLETYLTFVGMGISLSALAFLIVFYMLVPAIWNLTGLIYLSFSISLFLAQILFLTSRYTTSKKACAAVGSTMHYAFLVSFFWLNVVTINIWLTVCRNPCEMSRKGWKRFFSYSLYAWFTPLIIIIIAHSLDKYQPGSKYAPRYGYGGKCWLNNNIALLLFFAGPLAVIILLNFAAYVHTAVTIYKMRQFSVQNSEKADIKIIIINSKLCLLTGITWIFGYLAAINGSKGLQIVFVVLNATYGLWLAICFLTTENVFSQLKQKFRNVTQTTSTRTMT